MVSITTIARQHRAMTAVNNKKITWIRSFVPELCPFKVEKLNSRCDENFNQIKISRQGKWVTWDTIYAIYH